MVRGPTSCKEAISNWVVANEGAVASEALIIELRFQWPPIQKMDKALSTLTACRKLSLSSNMIEKIAGIAGMKNLKILVLARNNIQSLAGIETVSETLEELWISYNSIEIIKGIESLQSLRVLDMSNNLVIDWLEFNRVQDCPRLVELLLVGNPLYEAQSNVDSWRQEVTSQLPQLTKLDGILVPKKTKPKPVDMCPS